MYLSVFSGNLTADAVYNKLDGKERSPINFTIALNFPNGSAEFKKCVWWVETKDQPEVLKHLTKGKKILVHSNYYKTEPYEKDGVKHYSIVEYVNTLELSDFSANQAAPSESE